MGRKKIKTFINGETVDGNPVIKGVYHFVSTYGLPLVEFLYEAEEQNMVVDWVDYYDTALIKGMKSDRILTQVESAVREVYGETYCSTVMKLFELYIRTKLN